MRSDLTSAFRRIAGRATFRSPLLLLGSTYAKEAFYLNMVRSAAEADGIKLPALYPVASAANATLLYLLYRCAMETPVRSILEIGAGQSTLLLDAVSQKRGDLEIVTLETDASWAERTQARVRHRVAHSSIAGDAYADLSALGARKFDLVLVDGPHGTSRRSRATSLPILRSNLAQDHIVVFDDAERRGEQETAAECMETITPASHWRTIQGAKAQFVIYTDRFGAVAHF